MDKVILTQEGFEKLSAELNFLKTKKRREVAGQLEFARGLGDLRENAEYETAKEAKHQLEIRIGELEAKLGNAKIVDLSNLPTDKVLLGAVVDLKNLITGDKIRYILVTADESDFSKNRISITSPIGKGLVGKAVGDVAEIVIPAGKVKFEILKIARE